MMAVICLSSYSSSSLFEPAMSSDSKPSRREQSHERILEAASRAVCREGYSGVGVAAVMKEAGLTHGGFYAHFDSREALLAEALEYAGMKSVARLQERSRGRIARGASPLRALVEGYLSEAHLESLEEGCPVAALASEMARTGPELRAASSRRMRDLVKFVEGALPGGSPAGSAVAIAGTLIGALQMARTFEGAERRNVLRDCRAALLEQYDRGADVDAAG
jgi:TetR/AcrR family transcriptional repressor of nem operon